MEESTRQRLSPFLDRDGRLTKWPARKQQERRRLILEWLATCFTSGQVYRESEVNAILKLQVSFEDHVLLRRELCDAGLLIRTPDGRSYWLNEDIAPHSE